MASDYRFRFSPPLAKVLARCWLKASPPAAWNLSEIQFQAWLERSVSNRFREPAPDHKLVESYLEALHVGELALAAACSTGNSAAWDTFVGQYRPELYRAARAIAGEWQGRELADSMYAELFGLRETAGERKSLFEYFHGRSKLSTWLRAILAQRHVDNLRRAAHTESLDEPVQTGDAEARPKRELASPVNEAALDPERDTLLAILQTTMKSVLAALEPRDRLRLAYYYVDELTLAQIGKLLGEHEATVSRKIERTRRDVRLRVEARLRQEKKMSEAQLAQCLAYARDQWPFDLSTTLSARN
jgi:RNA polymerase sigma-70 factor (ECF subfamily)